MLYCTPSLGVILYPYFIWVSPSIRLYSCKDFSHCKPCNIFPLDQFAHAPNQILLQVLFFKAFFLIRKNIHFIVPVETINLFSSFNFFANFGDWFIDSAFLNVYKKKAQQCFLFIVCLVHVLYFIIIGKECVLYFKELSIGRRKEGICIL